MTLFASLQHHLIQRSIVRGDMPEERSIEINYSINFIPVSTQAFHQSSQLP
jgi:hypothetical protein